MSVRKLLKVVGIISFNRIDDDFYVSVKELHSNAELLELNNIQIVSIEVGLWSPITWR